MAESGSEQSLTRLLSSYNTDRDAEGDLVVRMPWPGRPVVGCIAPAAVVAIGAWLIAQLGNAPGMYGLSVMTVLFAVVVTPIVIYQSSHAWVLRRGFVKSAVTVGPRHLPTSEWLAAQSVVLKRELWPHGGGSTDKVLVMTDGGPAMRVACVYNWDGHESRLASGGMGSLARTGPTVASAPSPLTATADANLKSSASEAIQEITDLLAHELGVPLAYACGYARQRPDDTS